MAAALIKPFYIVNVLIRSIPEELRIVGPFCCYKHMITNWFLGSGAYYAKLLMSLYVFVTTQYFGM